MIGVAFFMKDISGLQVPLDPQGAIERVIYNSRMLHETHVFLIDQTTYNLSRYYEHGSAEIELEKFISLEELEQTHSGETFVYFENIQTILFDNIENYCCMTEFEHPESVIYVVGADFGGIPTEGREDKEWVYCPFEDMWAEHVLTIILHDRLHKEI